MVVTAYRGCPSLHIQVLALLSHDSLCTGPQSSSLVFKLLTRGCLGCIGVIFPLALHAGNRRAVDLRSIILEALKGTQEYNKGLKIIMGEAWLGAVCIGRSFRGRLVLKCIGCKTHKQHYRYVTPNAITKEEDLWCIYCMGESHEWGGKERASALERAVIKWLEKANLLEVFAWQVRPQWWTGRVDFSHFPTHMALQIDGRGHFEGQWYMGKKDVLMRDINCCLASHKGRAKLVRVTHGDIAAAHGQGIITAAIESRLEHYIVLSNGCWTATWQDEGGLQFCYVTELLRQLSGVTNLHLGAFGELWITWP